MLGNQKGEDVDELKRMLEDSQKEMKNWEKTWEQKLEEARREKAAKEEQEQEDKLAQIW